MKKVILGAAVLAAMMATSCQSEEMMGSQQQGDVVVKASTVNESRTYVEGKTIYWSEGDRLLAFGDDVLGSLTLVGQGGSTEGQFKGYVSGEVENLEYLLYPADMASYKNGKVTITIGTIDKKHSNAPMFAGWGSSVSFDLMTAMIRIQINNVPAKNNTLEISGNGIGTAVFEDGDVTYTENNNTIKVTGLEEGTNEICIPVFTSNETAAGNVKLTFKLAGATKELELPLKVGALTANSVPVLAYDAENNTLEEQETLPGNEDGETEGYVISTLTELVQFANMVNGGNSFEGETVTLANDIDLDNMPWTPIGTEEKPFSGTFDGGENTISNLNVAVEGKASAGFFADARGTIKNLNLQNVTINGNYKAGAVVGNGLCSKIENCHVNGGTITSTPNNNDDANNVGGIVGYLSAEPEAYVKNCSVTGLAITAYRDLGGIVGTANQNNPEISGNKVYDTEVVADQTVDYNEEKAANVGAICGKNLSGVSFGSYEISGVVVKTLVATADQLTKAVKMANDGQVIAFANDIKGDAIALQKADVDVIIDGENHKFDGTIYIYGQARYEGAETLTIQNVKFETNEKKDFISSNSTEGDKRYAHNVTVKNCSFIGNGEDEVVGMRYRQAYSIIVENCNGENLHSLIWATGTNGIELDNVEIKECKNGVSFGTSNGIKVKNSEISVTGDYSYAVRVDASGNYDMEVSGCKLEADVPVLLRKATGSYTLKFDGVNTLKTTDVYQIIVTESDYEEGKELTKPTGTADISGEETGWSIFNK